MREDDMSIRCHLCEFVAHSKATFDEHMMEHYDHQCPFCDYTSRTEGRLERHIKDFHSEIPPESWAGSRTARTSNGDASNSSSFSDTGSHSQLETGKPRKYRCKQCQFIAVSKEDFWAHTKSHIKSEKQLKCPECPFVTEYKHHLEYHLRNHYGSKPFKCEKCNYSCVNKSMLNSHLKSHSKVYQYRCADCSYATKYCHSLKQHLRKYTHKPSIVLNPDGTPNPYPIIDVYGTRRGPRPKKNKNENGELTSVVSPLSLNLSGHDFSGKMTEETKYSPPRSPDPRSPRSSRSLRSPRSPRSSSPAMSDVQEPPSTPSFDQQMDQRLTPELPLSIPQLPNMPPLPISSLPPYILTHLGVLFPYQSLNSIPSLVNHSAPPPSSVPSSGPIRMAEQQAIVPIPLDPSNPLDLRVSSSDRRSNTTTGHSAGLAVNRRVS